MQADRSVGADPTGILSIDRSGRISVQFIDSLIFPKFASNDRLEGTSEENKAVRMDFCLWYVLGQ